ncbi:MAG: HipA domain-containing protein [Pseudomonadota bacterium]|nr:HipA domain-containing protein [Pseudomonadota bacterium]
MTRFLETHGASSSAAIQRALNISQPTASRLLSKLADDIVPLGAGRATRYALAQPIGTHPSAQPLWMIDDRGMARRIGTVTFLAKSQIHVQADGVDQLFEPSAACPLPWYLSPLRAEGFLGRIQATNLAAQGLSSNPETWDTHAVLLAALHTHDAPGSLVLGRDCEKSALPVLSSQGAGAALDAMALDVAKTLPLGSSAGGEQPKFPVIDEQGQHLLVKFSPPLGTPFGERWSDLLCAELLANEVLARHGYEAAQGDILQTPARTYLLSRRFDRIGANGRKHVVSVGAVHAGFVKGAYANWASTCEALVRQGRLNAQDALRAHDLLQFGRLIGNTDMHSGNAGLMAKGASLAELVKGQFELAPSYDMLPMRWRPNPMLGLDDYAPFEPDLSLAGEGVRLAARDFWLSLSAHEGVSAALKRVARQMSTRMGITPQSPPEFKRFEPPCP